MGSEASVEEQAIEKPDRATANTACEQIRCKRFMISPAMVTMGTSEILVIAKYTESIVGGSWTLARKSP